MYLCLCVCTNVNECFTTLLICYIITFFHTLSSSPSCLSFICHTIFWCPSLLYIFSFPTLSRFFLSVPFLCVCFLEADSSWTDHCVLSLILAGVLFLAGPWRNWSLGGSGEEPGKAEQRTARPSAPPLLLPPSPAPLILLSYPLHPTLPTAPTWDRQGKWACYPGWMRHRMKECERGKESEREKMRERKKKEREKSEK